MDIEATEAQLSNLLGQEFHTLSILAEDDGLVDVQLREKSVEAVELLLFLKIGVVLCQSLKC